MTKKLTLEKFKKEIFDYTKNREWNYSGKPLIIDFYADWCGPCKRVAPVLEELSNENNNIDVYKVNTEEEQELSSLFQIRSIPTLIFVSKNEPPQVLSGFLPKEELEKIVKEVLKV